MIRARASLAIGAAVLLATLPLAAAGRAAAVSASAAGPAPAASAGLDATEPARRAAARRLLDASGFRARQIALAADGWEAARAEKLADCIDRAGSGRRLDCASTVPRDAKLKAILAAEQERTLDTLCAAAEALYAQRFTAAEMDQLSAFFQSDIGRKYSQAYPGILGRFQVVKRRILLDAINAAGAKLADSPPLPAH